MSNVSQFGTLDWTVVVLSLLVTLAAGYAAKKYVGGLSDYLVADRSMGVYVGVASLVSTEIGIITFVYYAELGFVGGFASFAAGMITAGVALFVGRSGFIIGRLRDLNIMTVPEYFQMRYTRGVRILAGVLMAVGGALNLGIFPKLEASFLNIVMGIPERHLEATMAILLGLVLIYTVAGGMVSLIVTNYIQYVLLSLAAVLVTAMAIYTVGWSDIVHAVDAHLGSAGFNPFANPDFGFTFILWQVLSWIAILTTWQAIAMRTFSTQDSEIGKKIFSLTSVLFLGRAVLPMFWGAAAMTYFQGSGDALTAMPRMIAAIVPSGLLGLLVAGMLAASMSTYSSYLLAWSSIISQDVIGPTLGRNLSERAKLRITRATVVALTIFIMIWGVLYQLPGPAYFYLTITANLFIAATLVGIIAGLYWPKASSCGAYLAFGLGAAGALGFFFADIPASYAGLASFGLAGLGMVVGSTVKPDRGAAYRR